jgi:hypothetical protein
MSKSSALERFITDFVKYNSTPNILIDQNKNFQLPLNFSSIFLSVNMSDIQ